jgi:Cu+-exporting ATPase
MSQIVTLKINGMTCASCVARVEKTLLKINEVEAASVNLATEKAQIRVSTDTKQDVFLPQLIQAIEKAGFHASLSQRIDQPKQISSFDLHSGLAVLVGIFLSLPLALPMALMLFDIHWMLPVWGQFLLASPVQFILGARFYIAAFKSVRSGSANMDLLVAIGTSAAYGLSIYEWYQSGWGEPHQIYFESSAVVISLVMLGKWLEAKAKKETTNAISALQELWPNEAKVLKAVATNQDYRLLPIDQVLPGDFVLVLPGERVPVDGLIIDGASDVDESMLTGETHLVLKELGSFVTGGSLNSTGRLIIHAKGIGEESTLAKMIQMVEEAQGEKAPIQRLVDQVSAWFVPAVILIAISNLIITYLILNNFETALIRSVAILVIACPCALGLATPAAIMVGTGLAAKLGILIKDAQALELAHRLTVVAFDKTGTLTTGHPQVKLFKNISAESGQDLIQNAPSDQSILAIALGLQMGSEHPLAKAVIAFSAQQSLKPELFNDLKIQPGTGIQGQYKDQIFAFISHHALLKNFESPKKNHISIAEDELKKGFSVSWLVNLTNNQMLALFSFGDQVKPGVEDVVSRLKAMQIKTVMISGDHQIVANQLAKVIGIDEVYAQVMPGDKAKIIQRLKAESSDAYIAMVGDGVNDAPALAAADVGIAMSTGTDIAMHVSGITLMRGDPGLVPDAIQISKETWRKIKQNLFWAFIYNLVGIPLAALGYLTPVVAGAAMAASSISVISNALLLKRWSRDW